MSLSALERKIAALTRAMAEAVAREEFEQAARLRDEIAALGAGTGLKVGQPPPGQMGLGTHVPVKAPPRDWTAPKKPDPLTRGHRPGRGRRA
jgi:hypothetical protein